MSEHKYTRPTVTDGPIGGQVLDHPAFGVISLTQTTGTAAMFGSDVPQMGSVRVEVKTARLHRELSRDWVRGQQTVVCLDMTHAQWAQFITSVGKGDGIPCTLSFREQVGNLPGIEKVETKNDTLRNEIKAAAQERLQNAQEAILTLKKMVDEGKTGKTALSPAIANALHHIEALPGSLRFVLASAEEALERGTADAKIEVESFIGIKAQQIGLQTITQLTQIPNGVKQS